MAVDRYGTGDAPEDREARVAYVLARALSLSDELKSTVVELTEMLHYDSEEEVSDHSE